MSDKLNILFNQIKNECLDLISRKKVDLDDLSFALGMNKEKMYDLFKNRNEDFSIYLKMYDLLVEW